MTATTIALALQKGGVGKTTTTASLGMELARDGARVLLVDTDHQGNLTTALGVSVGPDDPTIYELLINPALATALPIVTTDYGVDLIPATMRLAGAEMRLASKYGREQLLRSGLRIARQEYDYILIDSPPSLGLLTANALVAADTIIVPLQAHWFALQAMEQLSETIQEIRAINPSLHIGGIVLTMADRRTGLTREIERAARDAYGDLVFQATIPLSTRLAEAPAVGQPIAAYAAGSAGASAYAALAEEVRARWAVS
jgi:chromosome partitioning protein